MYIKCSKSLLPARKLCKRSDCDCHLPRVDLDMTYTLRSEGQDVSKSKMILLSQSKLRICLKRFLGEAATAVEDFQISRLNIEVEASLKALCVLARDELLEQSDK